MSAYSFVTNIFHGLSSYPAPDKKYVTKAPGAPGHTYMHAYIFTGIHTHTYMNKRTYIPAYVHTQAYKHIERNTHFLETKIYEKFLQLAGLANPRYDEPLVVLIVAFIATLLQVHATHPASRSAAFV